MNERAPRPAALILMLSICGFVTGVARADVTLEHSMAVEGVGIMADADASAAQTTPAAMSGRNCIAAGPW